MKSFLRFFVENDDLIIDLIDKSTGKNVGDYQRKNSFS